MKTTPVIEELLNLYANNRVWFEMDKDITNRLLELTGMTRVELQVEMDKRRRATKIAQNKGGK